MNFKAYDILTSIIPGAFCIVILSLLYVFALESSGEVMKEVKELKDFSSILLLFLLVLSLLLGNVIHAIASWTEPALWWIWGGRPSKLLLEGKTKRITLLERESVKKIISEEIQKDGRETAPDFKTVFLKARSISVNTQSAGSAARSQEFHESYVFSRNIFMAMVIVFLAQLPLLSQGLHWAFPVVTVALGTVYFFRCRDRALYNSREILVSAHYFLKNK
jgi:hypothetical protein